MKNLYRIFLSACSLLIVVATQAQQVLQGNGQPETAVGMRASGKIYVVVAVIVTILAGLIIYMINLDKKISRLEKDIKN